MSALSLILLCSCGLLLRVMAAPTEVNSNKITESWMIAFPTEPNSNAANDFKGNGTKTPAVINRASLTAEAPACEGRCGSEDCDMRKKECRPWSEPP